MKPFYLVATIIGAVVPYLFFIDFFVTDGFAITTFLYAVFANSAAAGFTADLLISSFVFWIWMMSQQTSKIWLYILVNMTIGLSCALPLYLYMHSDSKNAAVAG